VEIAGPGGLVVAAEVGRRFVVPDTVHAREDRLSRRRAPFFRLEDAGRLLVLLGAGALPDRAAVRVGLDPPDGGLAQRPGRLRLLVGLAARGVLRSVQVSHHALPSPGPSAGGCRTRCQAVSGPWIA